MSYTYQSVRRLLVSLVPVFLACGQAWAGDLVLSPPLMSELNMLLRASEPLHRSLVLQNEEQTELSLRDVLWQIEQVRGASVYAKDHERGHLMRILEIARERFELTQALYGEERRLRLEEGFNQLVNLVRIYRLDRSYAIFFCPRDKSSWVQRGRKAQNPFRPDIMKDCGMRVPN